MTTLTLTEPKPYRWNSGLGSLEIHVQAIEDNIRDFCATVAPSMGMNGMPAAPAEYTDPRDIRAHYWTVLRNVILCGVTVDTTYTEDKAVRVCRRLVSQTTFPESLPSGVLNDDTYRDAYDEGQQDLALLRGVRNRYDNMPCGYVLELPRADYDELDKPMGEVLPMPERFKKFNFVDFSDTQWWDKPQAEFKIPYLAIEGETVLVPARRGTGKSLLWLDVALGMSVTGEVLGEPVKTCPVLYIDRENSENTIRDRLRAMGAGPEIDMMHFHYSLLGDWPKLDTPRGGLALREVVEHFKAEVVILDAMSKTIAGKENDAETWQNLHESSIVALKRAGVTIIQLDNTGKDADKGSRGSSAKEDNADHIWTMTVTDDKRYVTLTDGKNRSGRYASEVRLERSEAAGVFGHAVSDNAMGEAVSRRGEVLRVVDDLDELGVPDTAGRVQCQKALKADGRTPPAQRVLDAAIKERKERAMSDSE